MRFVLLASFPVGPLGCNCSVIADEATRRAIVIDPGGDFERIAAELRQHQLTVTAIVHTHTHIDHVGATAPLQESTGAQAHIHEADRPLYDMLPVQAAWLGVPVPKRCDLQGSLNDGHCLHAGSLELGVLHTPGHTPGSVSFIVKGPERSLVFTGDTLFQRGVGRTDLWGGDESALIHSIQDRLLTLDDETYVIPGHGPSTTIGDERQLNPFLQRR